MTIKKQNPNNKKKLKYIYSFDKKTKILIRAKVLFVFPPNKKSIRLVLACYLERKKSPDTIYSAKETLRTLTPM